MPIVLDATKIFTERDAVCTKCGLFLSRSENSSQTYCGRCDDQQFDIARAVGTYDDALSAAVIRLKHTPSVAKTARNYLTEAALRNSFDKCELIIPVPISKQRLLERGFNQAAVLAGIVGNPTAFQSTSRACNGPSTRRCTGPRWTEKPAKRQSKSIFRGPPEICRRPQHPAYRRRLDLGFNCFVLRKGAEKQRRGEGQCPDPRPRRLITDRDYGLSLFGTGTSPAMPHGEL